MNTHYFERFLHFVAGVGWVMGLVWIGLCVFSVGLLILMYTRWGQSHPLEKCIGLSLFAHVLLAVYATTISLTGPSPPPVEPAFEIALVDGDSEQDVPGGLSARTESAAKTEKPWDVHEEAVALPAPEKSEHEDSDLPAPALTAASEPDKLPGGPAEQTANSKNASSERNSAALDEAFPPDTSTESVAPPLEGPSEQLPPQIPPDIATKSHARVFAGTGEYGERSPPARFHRKSRVVERSRATCRAAGGQRGRARDVQAPRHAQPRRGRGASRRLAGNGKGRAGRAPMACRQPSRRWPLEGRRPRRRPRRQRSRSRPAKCRQPVRYRHHRLSLARLPRFGQYSRAGRIQRQYPPRAGIPAARASARRQSRRQRIDLRTRCTATPWPRAP